MSKFESGNTIGMDTRFKPGHQLSCKYKAVYTDSLLAYFVQQSATNALPTIEGWAIENKLKIRTVYDWIEKPEKYPHFADAYAQAKAIQKNMLMQKGLTETYNASLVKFLLSNNHGMKEKVEQDVNAGGALQVNINVVD